VVNKEVGRVYVDGFEEEDVFDSRIEVDATDAIHFISSLRHLQILTLMSIEFSGNISLTFDFQSNTRATNKPVPSLHSQLNTECTQRIGYINSRITFIAIARTAFRWSQ
jgi:hypothetical protein